MYLPTVGDFSLCGGCGWGLKGNLPVTPYHMASDVKGFRVIPGFYTELVVAQVSF
jgi:hypothetical protein